MTVSLGSRSRQGIHTGGQTVSVLIAMKVICSMTNWIFCTFSDIQLNELYTIQWKNMLIDQFQVCDWISFHSDTFSKWIFRILVHVDKPVAVHVEKKVPYTVIKKTHYPVHVPVDKPYPVHVDHPVPCKLNEHCQPYTHLL